MIPRKHAELIKAWAYGAEIQRRNRYLGIWIDNPNPTWEEDEIYRIKPMPKEDFVQYGFMEFHPECGAPRYCIQANVTFDGETGEAKKVEIVK